MLVLLGCPQLLDDDFDSTSIRPDAGGSLGTAGAAGAAGAAAAGSGGGGGDAAAGGAGGAGGGADDALADVLIHRYRFQDPGPRIVDSVGNAHGNAVGAMQSGGRVTLTGNNYVDLPNGILSGLTSVTFEAWVTWTPDPFGTNSDWQILLSFGTNANGEGLQGSGTTYLALTPKASDSGDIRASYTLTGYDNEVYTDANAPLPTAAGTQIVYVVDGVRGSLAVYVDGVLASSQAGLRIDLSAIDDVNNWIGRSQFSVDPNFVGDVLDFRIYAAALSATQVALSHDLGADAAL